MGDLAKHLLVLLSEESGLTAREIAWRLRSSGRLVHKKDINPLLYADGRFCQDGGPVPRWRLATQLSEGPGHEARIERKRRKRQLLDVRQDRVSALPAVERVGFRDSDLEEALALLRRHGVQVPEQAGPDTRKASAAREREQDSQAQRSSARPTGPSRAPVEVPAWCIQGLRPWQQEALEAWYAAGCTGVCEAVTGTGKTHLGLEAVAQTVRRGGRATVLVPSVLLQRQWELRLAEFLPCAAVARVGGPRRGVPAAADVVVAVVNSATTTDLTQLGTCMELLVADEVHRYGGSSWSAALRDGYRLRLGLTATLERGSDDGVAERLLPYFGRVVHAYGYDRATREDVVAPFDLLFLGVALTPEERLEHDALSRRLAEARSVLLRAGASMATLHQELGVLRSRGGNVARAAMVYENATRERRRLLAETPAKVEALRRLADLVNESNGTVVFTQSVATASAAAQALEEEGCTAAAAHSGLSASLRQRLIDDLGDGALQALAAPKILDEGVDVPDIDLGVVMGASSSRRQMIQRLGRVIRLKPDGRRARFVVLYVTDSVEDPETGSRQDFMIEVEEAASRIVLQADWSEEDLDAAWAGVAPRWTYEPDG